MNGKFLGKIIDAEFGIDKDYPYLFGLKLTFNMLGIGYVSTSSVYMENMSDECKWNSELEKNEAYIKCLKFMYDLLKEANVCNVEDLIGKSVEVFIENRTFKNFKILKD